VKTRWTQHSDPAQEVWCGGMSAASATEAATSAAVWVHSTPLATPRMPLLSMLLAMTRIVACTCCCPVHMSLWSEGAA
jgi:hypothetical protein